MKKFVLLVCFLMCACQSSVKPHRPPLILTGLPPYAWIVERLAGSEVEIRSLLGPSADPHLFEISPRDLTDIELAPVLIGVGEGFENRVATRLAEKNPHFVYLNFSKTLPRLSCHDPYTITAKSSHTRVMNQMETVRY